MTEEPQPVRVCVILDRLDALLSAAHVCAEDLIAHVEAASPGDHPVSVRRRDRDTSEARDLLDLVRAIRDEHFPPLFARNPE